MEESKKKPVMIGIIVVCLGVAGLVTYMRSSGGGGGINSISDAEMKWVVCNNPACKAEYEMGKKKYLKDLQANMNPNPMNPAPTLLTCKECNKKSLYSAIKCTNTDCGSVFIEGISGQDENADLCPDCGKSEITESRRRRLAGE